MPNESSVDKLKTALDKISQVYKDYSADINIKADLFKELNDAILSIKAAISYL